MMNKRLYHITDNSNLDSIMRNGLLPSSHTGIHNIYLGKQGDPNYVYFWVKNIFDIMFTGKIEITRTFYNPEEKTILEVVLSKDYCLERDYDQLMVFIGDCEADIIVQALEERLERTFSGDFTKENIIRSIDSVDQGIWDNNHGAYRSKQPVESSSITIVRPEDLVKELNITYSD